MLTSKCEDLHAKPHPIRPTQFTYSFAWKNNLAVLPREDPGSAQEEYRPGGEANTVPSNAQQQGAPRNHQTVVVPPRQDLENGQLHPN